MTSLLCMLQEATIKIKPLHHLRGDISLKVVTPLWDTFSHLLFSRLEKQISKNISGKKKTAPSLYVAEYKSTSNFLSLCGGRVSTHLSLGIWWLGLW